MTSIIKDYGWTTAPLVVGAPMRLIALPLLATSISAAGGFGFIGAGSNLDELDGWLEEAAIMIAGHQNLSEYHQVTGILPVGFGYFNWAAEADLEKAIVAVRKWKPAAVWQFGAHKNADYATWAAKIREASDGKTKVWVQVGSVADAVDVATHTQPDVLVVQGTDAGGHGLQQGAGIISLLPEIADALVAHKLSSVKLIAAGGIVEGRGTAAALVLGADGICLGTRLLASEEANVVEGYRREVVRASDGGVSTARTKVYDQLRGTVLWPEGYNARGILNQSFRDHGSGINFDENKKLYDAAMLKGDAGFGPDGRMTTYAGAGVGLVRSVMKAGDIVREIQEDSTKLLRVALTI